MVTLRILVAFVCVVGCAQTAAAQTFPNKPVRLILWGPGSFPDIVARRMKEHLAVRWGQPVIVENRAGAGGLLAAATGVQAPPARGESVDRTVALYIDALNEALRNRPAGMTIVVHLCRGNVGEGMASTGYDPIAERVFATLNVDGFLLEYDTPRAGDFAPLRFVAKDRFVALGLVSTKMPDVENADDLRRRIDEAARVFPLDRLGLCPQCGFASGFRTARLTIADEERKLANLVRVAEQVWG